MSLSEWFKRQWGKSEPLPMVKPPTRLVRTLDLENPCEEVPLEISEPVPDHVVQTAIDAIELMEGDDPPMDEDYSPAYTIKTIKPLTDMPSMIRAIDAMLKTCPNQVKEPEMSTNCCTEKNVPASVPTKFHALYEVDGETNAVGPFDCQRDARLWLSGFTAGVTDSDDYSVIGVVSDFVNFGTVNEEAPNLGS
jgi:hypothetical protein